MDEIDAFFESVPWDALKEEGSQVPFSADASAFFKSLLVKSSPTKTQPGPPSPTKSVEPVNDTAPAPALTWPRLSLLTAHEQSFYLAARYGGGQAGAARNQPLFQRLHPLVLAEQREFVEWALKVTASCPPPQPDTELVAQGAQLLAKRQEELLKTLHEKKYGLLKRIPLLKPSQKPVHLRPVQHLHSEGRVAVCRRLEGINCTLPAQISQSKRSQQITDDPLAARLATEHSADIVISPGALLALVDPSGHDMDVPLTITQLKGAGEKTQKVLMLEKPLPPLALSDLQKMSWAARRAAKEAFFSCKKKYLDFSTMKVEREEMDFQHELKNYNAAKAGNLNTNHVYAVWCLEYERALRTADSAWGRQGCPIRLLVRSQCHGFQEREHVAPLFVHLGVKLEWATKLGAQTTTLSETARDWVAMTLRPEAVLLRARVDAETLQVVQVEAKDAKTISAEARVRGLDASKTLGALHTLLAELMQLPEGSYLLRVERKGAALKIFGAPSSAPGSNIDLTEEYAKASTIKSPNEVAGAAIDPDIVTPCLLQHERVPATFAPKPQSPRKYSKKSHSKKRKTDMTLRS